MINAYQQYQQNAILSSPPEKLVLMLYEGALKFLKLAKKSIEERNFVEANNNIIRVEDIVIELNMSLDMNYEISKNLRSLYNFIYEKLIQANIKKDARILEEVEGILIGLKEAWQEAYLEVMKTKKAAL
ncbi:flagellar export chaperone FliS [Thermovenabulum gondwanense]|uniref:Flagellar secretion chaperone FliS n=1 Tax=Thermovenabulum gondwanense TaxID=520767 RepID=A0A162M589_9FIRM|nr:flagellar export chaperone FliS [Thermovenabulum gondwanense]KYO64100.1 Flagellar protein FliS [Thermovenabulum gondwanense]